MNKLQMTVSVLVLAVAFTSAASAQTYFVSQKILESYQAGNNAPQADVTGGYLFQDVESSYTYTTVTGPDGTNTISSVANGGGNYSYKSSAYDTQAALDTAYADGTYTFNPSGPSSSLTGDQYPSAPELTAVNGVTPTWSNGDLVLNPTIQNTFTWTAYSATNTEGFTFTTGGEIQFKLTGGSINLRQTAVGPAGQSAFNNYMVAANTLSNNSTYNLDIAYFLSDAGSGTSTFDAAGYEGDNNITVVTATPEPSTVGLLLGGVGLLVLLPRLRQLGTHASSVVS
jgi:hypothetical protein